MRDFGCVLCSGGSWARLSSWEALGGSRAGASVHLGMPLDGRFYRYLWMYCVSCQKRYRYLPVYSIAFAKFDNDLPVYSIARAIFYCDLPVYSIARGSLLSRFTCLFHSLLGGPGAI